MKTTRVGQNETCSSPHLQGNCDEKFFISSQGQKKHGLQTGAGIKGRDKQAELSRGSSPWVEGRGPLHPQPKTSHKGGRGFLEWRPEMTARALPKAPRANVPIRSNQACANVCFPRVCRFGWSGLGPPSLVPKRKQRRSHSTHTCFAISVPTR